MAATQTVVWSIASGTVTRINTSGTGKVGCGNSKRFYVDRYGSNDYTSYLKPTLDWTGVGKIVRAILVLYSDDGLGSISDIAAETDTPKLRVRRLTTPFTEGNNADGTFDSTDYTVPGTTSVAEVAFSPTREANGLNRIDITKLVNAWAPPGVKRSDGTTGAAAAAHGLALIRSASGANVKNAWTGWSEDATDGALRPTIELTYEYGATVPDAPTSVSPSGAQLALEEFAGDFSDIRATDKLARSNVQVYTSAVTAAGQVISLNVGTLLYDKTQAESAAAILAGRFSHIPSGLVLKVNTTYKWRSRVYDQEGQVSLWTALTSFSVTDQAPNAPTLTPTTGKTYATFDGVKFAGSATDPDAGDKMASYQVQMSAYPEGDEHWDDDEFILWNTGKRPLPTRSGLTFTTPYGGQSLTAGTYYWRARMWDTHQSVGNWAYSQIILSADFAVEPDGTQTSIQQRPRAPYRIVIKDMLQTDRVTRTVGRGPGNVVAILEGPKMPGAAELFNSPGELHFTLGVEDPQLSVIEPKQTHYSVQFRQGDGWREVYQGLMWDFDATDTDIVLYGLDYMALLDMIVDERYVPANPDLPAEKGGSKYVTAGKNSISYIVTDQLTRAKNLANSPVGFITVGSIATMSETVVVFSTYAPTLTFITSLLDSHRAGTGKKTRLFVRQKVGGGYEWTVQDDPGVVRDNLRLRFGELVQGYRVIAFGSDWASRVSAIGRAKDGLKVMYSTASAPGIDETVWGRFSRVVLLDGVSDQNDLIRRTKQAALHAGKLGKSVAVGLRSGTIAPKDGYVICDQVPLDIEHGGVSTDAFGSGYWTIVGITWTVDTKTDKQDTTLTLSPREDSTPPDSDLLTLSEISPQAEWQIGWTSPNPLTASSKYWLDQNTGKVYLRSGGTLIATGITGS